MSRSIYSWFAERERQPLDDALDDEVVERQAPWDLPGTRAKRGSATRAGRSAASSAGGSSSQAGKRLVRQDAASKAQTPKPAVGKQAQGGGQQRAQGSGTARPVTVPAGLRRQIILRVRAQPNASGKKVAASPRADGLVVTRAQVVAVKQSLSSSKTARRTPPMPPAARRASTVQRIAAKTSTSRRKRIKASGGSDRPSPTTPLCDACGRRVNLLAGCGCS